MAIKDLFIKSETSESAPVSATPVASSTSVPQSAPSSVSPAIAPTSIASNEKMVDKIWDDIINQNLPGPDYLELKNNVSALEGMPLSDEQKLVSAYSILKANYPKANLSKEIILRAIDTYVNVVNDTKKAGLEQVAKMRAERVEGVEATIVSLKNEAAALKQKYEEILRQIEEYSTKAATESLSINNDETMFLASIDTVLNTLQSDKAKISSLNI